MNMNAVINYLNKGFFFAFPRVESSFGNRNVKTITASKGREIKSALENVEKDHFA